MKKGFDIIFYLFLLNLNDDFFKVECTNITLVASRLRMHNKTYEIISKFDKLKVAVKRNSGNLTIEDFNNLLKNLLKLQEMIIKMKKRMIVDKKNMSNHITAKKDEKKLSKNEVAHKLKEDLKIVKKKNLFISLELNEIIEFTKFLRKIIKREEKMAFLNVNTVNSELSYTYQVNSLVLFILSMINRNVTKDLRVITINKSLFYIDMAIERCLKLENLCLEKVYMFLERVFESYIASLYRYEYLKLIYYTHKFSRCKTPSQPLMFLFRSYKFFIYQNYLLFASLLKKISFGDEIVKRFSSSILVRLEQIKTYENAKKYNDIIVNLQNSLEYGFDILKTAPEICFNDIKIETKFKIFVYNAKLTIQTLLAKKDAFEYNLILDECYNRFCGRFGSFVKKKLKFIPSKDKNTAILIYNFHCMFIEQFEIFDIFEELISKDTSSK